MLIPYKYPTGDINKKTVTKYVVSIVFTNIFIKKHHHTW